jgi:lipopolysaccharide export system protein LptC
MRWVVAAIAAVLVVCLIGWARGANHHRGDEVGSLGSTVTALAGP